MENKFDINSEEVKRILSLHEDATKNQYLNVISEQQVQKTIKLTRDHRFSSSDGTTYYFPINSVFTSDSNGAKSSFTDNLSTFNMFFTCPKTFKVNTITLTPQDKNTVNFFNQQFCKTQPKQQVEKNVQQTGGLNKTNGQYKVTSDVVVNSRAGEGAEPKSFTINSTSVIYPNYKNNSVIIQGVINDDKKKLADYNLKLTCGTGELEYGDNTARFYGKDSQIIKTLSSTYCVGNKLKNWNELLGKKEKPVVNQLTIQQRQQQFIQQVTTNNKLIQTSLGVQQPTGQLTTADIDAIITKLG
jgi:hypothetical protein